LRRMEEAERQFLKGVEAEPKRIASQIHLGDFYLLWGKKEKALETFKKGMEIDSKDIPSRAKLAEFYLNDRKYPEAQGMVDEILKINARG
jgi:tetratricopeptide (TPR) repeat protein